MKLLGKKHGRNSSEHSLWRDFLHMIPDTRQKQTERRDNFQSGRKYFQTIHGPGLDVQNM